MTIPFEVEQVESSIDLLELEVRRLPGVINVSVVDEDESSRISVVAPRALDEDELRRSVIQLTRTYSERPFNVDIDLNVAKPVSEVESSGTAAPEAAAAVITRPDLVDVTTNDDSIVVRLSWQGRIGTGQSSSRTLNHAAEATLLALDELRMPVPFYVRSVTPLGAALRDAVVVVMRSSEAAEERFGVATGDSAREATVRATLDALNRYLAFHYSN